MKKANLAARIIAVIMLLVVLASGIVIAVGIYTNGFESIKSKYALVDGVVIKSGKSVYTLTENKTGDLVVNLKGAGFKAAKWGNYTVEVKSNPESGIAFSVGDAAYKYEDIDFTPFVKMEILDNRLTIPAKKCDIKTLLKKEYGGGVKVDLSDYNAEAGMYTVTVTPEKGKGVSFGLNGILEPTGIDFSNNNDVIIG